MLKDTLGKHERGELPIHKPTAEEEEAVSSNSLRRPCEVVADRAALVACRLLHNRTVSITQ